MTRQNVPLFSGAENAHQRFTAQLGENFVELRINYIKTTGQWAVDILREGAILAAGCMLESNADIIRSYGLDIGRLIFVGEQATLENLGKTNRLVWVSPDD